MKSKKDDSLIEIATSSDLFNANIIAGKLEANGISTFVRDCTDLAFHYSPYQPMGDYKVYIFEADKARAEAILSDANTSIY